MTMCISTFVSHTVAALILMPIIVEVRYTGLPREAGDGRGGEEGILVLCMAWQQLHVHRPSHPYNASTKQGRESYIISSGENRCHIRGPRENLERPRQPSRPSAQLLQAPCQNNVLVAVRGNP